jgi:predicted CXXCH cytochrome family protein
MAQIRNTAHDLSSSSTVASGVKSTTSNQICVFCHTPHNARSTRLLWNRADSAAVPSWGLDMDGNAVTATIEGTPLPTTVAALNSGSQRCLSCHDGTVAIGDVLTGTDPTMATVAGRVTAAGMMDPANPARVAAGGNLGGNHPISIPYAGEAGSSALGDGSAGNYYAEFTDVTCTSPSGVCTSAGTTDGKNGLAVNLVQTGAVSTVECSTCHEPHNRYAFAKFLRVDNTVASGLCRSCHNK